jgi:apolipoprotein D and lipocalin family protein
MTHYSFRWLSLMVLTGSAAVASAQAPLRTVQEVDLKRYSGEWYEVARMPNRWEDECVSDVTVDYALKPDGGMNFRNVCLEKNGATNTSHSRAKVVDKTTNAKMKVTFFWPLSADYWIIALDGNYKWAVVGQPDREYLWVLSRTPSLPTPVMAHIRKTIDASGYESSRLILTKQDNKLDAAPILRNP